MVLEGNSYRKEKNLKKSNRSDVPTTDLANGLAAVAQPLAPVHVCTWAGAPARTVELACGSTPPFHRSTCCSPSQESAVCELCHAAPSSAAGVAMAQQKLRLASPPPWRPLGKPRRLPAADGSCRSSHPHGERQRTACAIHVIHPIMTRHLSLQPAGPEGHAGPSRSVVANYVLPGHALQRVLV